jgi:dolichol-phosphate mannosyltransferase
MKTCIMIPTYNEAENIGDLIKDIRAIVPDAEVLVVDDNSPDGTWEIVDEISKSDSQVHLLHRTNERGRGTAGRDGFLWALKNNYERCVEMDADYSHHPKYLPAILEASNRADIVLGSRYVKGGREVGRSAFRQIVTKFAGAFLRAMLGVKVRDPSSGYRCFDARVLEVVDLNNFISTGPSIVSEMLYKARLKNYTFAEVPIVFEDRVRGASKLDGRTLFKTLGMVMKLRKLHRAGKF